MKLTESMILSRTNSRATPLSRVRSRLVASSCDCSHLVDLCNMTGDGVGGDEIFLSGLHLDLVAVELRKGAIFLQRPRRPRVAGLSVQLGGLLDGEGVLVVRRTDAAGGRSWVDDTAARLHPAPVIPTRRRCSCVGPIALLTSRVASPAACGGITPLVRKQDITMMHWRRWHEDTC